MKKKLIFSPLLALLFPAVSLFAQFAKGDKLLGAGFGVSTYKSVTDFGIAPQANKSSDFNLSAQFGFAPKENKLNGFYINAGYGVRRTEFTAMPSSNIKIDILNLGAGYFMRSYKSLGKDFYLFGEGSVGVNYADQKNPAGSPSDIISYGIHAGLQPGVAYKATKRILLEIIFSDLISAGYRHEESKIPNTGTTKLDNFSLNSSLGLGYLSNIGIGAKWIIPSKNKSK